MAQSMPLNADTMDTDTMDAPQINTVGTVDLKPRFAFHRVVDDICDLQWQTLSADHLVHVAWAYYYFSIQFRENLEAARKLFPDDEHLLELDRGERNTDNLSPWPGVAAAGERMHHDEFMRRTLQLAAIPEAKQRGLEASGATYLARTRAADEMTKALSISSYEDGGLEKVFGAILRAPHWEGPLLQAFKHFLSEHIRFDSDPDAGHGALCRHIPPNDSVLPLWAAFRTLLLEAAPDLAAM